MRYPTPVLPRSVVAVIGAVGLLVAGCSSEVPSEPVDSQPLSQPDSPPIDQARCEEDPPTGDIDREGYDLSFGQGSMFIAVTPDDAQGNASSRGPRCYEFARWGNPEPEVPPDSLLFLFKGTGTDGTQLEFLVGEFTGGVIPPIGGERDPIGPLTDPIPAQVGLSLDGKYHLAQGCELRLTAMSSSQAAGSFSCPTAVETGVNPFAPSDDVTQQAPGPGSGEPTPEVDGSDPVVLSGWFSLTP